MVNGLLFCTLLRHPNHAFIHPIHTVVMVSSAQEPVALGQSDKETELPTASPTTTKPRLRSKLYFVQKRQC